jgi:hypothetical protein
MRALRTSGVRFASVAAVAATLLLPSVAPAQQAPERYVVFEAFLRPT